MQIEGFSDAIMVLLGRMNMRIIVNSIHHHHHHRHHHNQKTIFSTNHHRNTNSNTTDNSNSDYQNNVGWGVVVRQTRIKVSGAGVQGLGFAGFRGYGGAVGVGGLKLLLQFGSLAP